MIEGLVLGLPIVLAVAAFVAAHVLLVVGLAIVAAISIGLLVMNKKGANGVNPPGTAASLNQALDPQAPRVFVFGHTLCGNDERYWELYGTNKYDQVIAAASHRITSYGKFFVEGLEVTFSGNAATGTASQAAVGTSPAIASSSKYANGALSKYNVLNGVTGTTGFGVTVGNGSVYKSTSASMTGCAAYLLKWDYSQDKLPNGVPSQTAQEITGGCPVYDPRKDGTNGGTGSHRPNDNSTWEYTPTDSNGQPIGRNNALQLLTYLLGWYQANVQTGAKVLLWGRGVQITDIDFANWIAAANTCETEGYYADWQSNSGQSHANNEQVLCDASQGMLIDVGGLWSYYPATNDTASIAIALIETDIISGVSWDTTTGLVSKYNSVKGTFSDPSVQTLWQQQPYPIVTNATYLSQDNGVSRPYTLNLQAITDPALAQKLARIFLNRNRLTGQFKATFKWTIFKARVWDCITLNYAPLGFSAKLFRITQMSINPTGGIDATFVEEAASVYTAGTVNSYSAALNPATYIPGVSGGYKPTKNGVFIQTTDPSLVATNNVTDGDHWQNPSNGNYYIRLSGSWNFIAKTATPLVDQDVIFDSSTPGTYSFTIPSNALTHVDIFVFGGGGGAHDLVAHGGGGSGYCRRITIAVTAGTTAFTIVVGGGGRGASTPDGIVATAGTPSSVANLVGTALVSTMTANGGGAATSSAAGTGGTATGGGTNTTGEAGDLGTAGNGGANLGTGGIGPTGGARQTVAGANGNAPGGGGAAGTGAGFGAFGRVVIYTRT